MYNDCGKICNQSLPYSPTYRFITHNHQYEWIPVFMNGLKAQTINQKDEYVAIFIPKVMLCIQSKYVNV